MNGWCIKYMYLKFINFSYRKRIDGLIESSFSKKIEWWEFCLSQVNISQDISLFILPFNRDHKEPFTNNVGVVRELGIADFGWRTQANKGQNKVYKKTKNWFSVLFFCFVFLSYFSLFSFSFFFWWVFGGRKKHNPFFLYGPSTGRLLNIRTTLKLCQENVCARMVSE